jgi:hypothetical protein
MLLSSLALVLVVLAAARAAAFVRSRPGVHRLHARLRIQGGIS